MTSRWRRWSVGILTLAFALSVPFGATHEHGQQQQQVPYPSASVSVGAGGEVLRSGAEDNANAANVLAEPDKFAHLVSLMQTMNSTDLMKVGQMFFMHKVSEILMPPEVHEDLGFDPREWEREQFTSHPLALAMLSTSAADGDSEEFTRVFQSRLLEFGAVVVPSVIPRELCKKLDLAIHAELREYPTYSLGNIMEREFRLDYPLPLTKVYADALVEAVRVLYTGLAPILGDDAVLVEFSALNSYPRTKRQNRHPDLGMSSPNDLRTKNRVVSVFVYLDDVTPDMAALDVWPGTHSHFHFLASDERSMMVSVPAVRMAVPAGTMVAYDARTLHRGSENTSPRRRPTMYFSFMEQGAGKETPEGPTYSARAEFKDAGLTLKNIATAEDPFAGLMATEADLRKLYTDCQALFRAYCCLGGPMKCHLVRDGVQSEPDCQRCVANFNSVQDHANVDCSKLDVRRFIDDGCGGDDIPGHAFAFLRNDV